MIGGALSLDLPKTSLDVLNRYGDSIGVALARQRSGCRLFSAHSGAKLPLPRTFPRFIDEALAAERARPDVAGH